MRLCYLCRRFISDDGCRRKVTPTWADVIIGGFSQRTVYWPIFTGPISTTREYFMPRRPTRISSPTQDPATRYKHLALDLSLRLDDMVAPGGEDLAVLVLLLAARLAENATTWQNFHSSVSSVQGSLTEAARNYFRLKSEGQRTGPAAAPRMRPPG